MIGRYGGWAQFDIGFVREAVVEAAQRDENLFFAFMNTEPFSNGIPNIIHLPAQVDAVEKRKVDNTCDAYLDDRRGGETFGLACAEFAICGRPVIGYARGRSRAHVRILGDKMVRYKGQGRAAGDLGRVPAGPVPDGRQRLPRLLAGAGDGDVRPDVHPVPEPQELLTRGGGARSVAQIASLVSE